ncbi:MAG: hypothetical protein C4321_06880 [Chloroflexota bacterium]
MKSGGHARGAVSLLLFWPFLLPRIVFAIFSTDQPPAGSDQGRVAGRLMIELQLWHASHTPHLKLYILPGIVFALFLWRADALGDCRRSIPTIWSFPWIAWEEAGGRLWT